MKHKFSVKKLVLRGVYDPRINQGVWLSLATGLLYLGFVLAACERLAIFSILAILPSLLAGVDQPGPRFPLRLLRTAFLFFVIALLVLFASRSEVPPVLIFFPLILVLALFAAYGNEAGKMGTGAMIVATLSLSWPPAASLLLFPLLISFGTLWYGLCARLWMLWWGHRVLRDILAQLFTAIGDYYALKTRLLLHRGSREEFSAVYAQQEKVYSLINRSKVYLNRYGEKGYDPELKKLKQNFLFAVDLMELLQANQYKLEEVQSFIANHRLAPLFSLLSTSLVSGLKKKSFAIRTRREVRLAVDAAFTAFEEAVLANREADTPFVRSLILHLHALKNLLDTQKPAFARVLGVPEAVDGFVASLKPHLSFRSPVFRYGLRLAVTMSCGVLVAGVLALDKSYWLLLAILLVMQSGYLLTKTLISQRVLGTLAGVLLGLVLIQLPAGGGMLLASALLLALFSFSMIFHHKIWSITGLTALVVLGYQLAFGRGGEVVYIRLVDSFLGCGLAFASNILLWPQWHGGGIKRLIKETLLAQEDILVLCIRSLSDRSIKSEQLTRRRLQLYTAQNNLLASYQQMLREPQHTREYVDSLDRVLSHFVATSAHINALLPMSREIAPMSVEVTRHMERAATAMFSRCDEEPVVEHIDLMEELKTVYALLEEVKQRDDDPRHIAIIHLLELIYERLNAIFEILDFCDSADLPAQRWL